MKLFSPRVSSHLLAGISIACLLAFSPQLGLAQAEAGPALYAKLIIEPAPDAVAARVVSRAPEATTDADLPDAPEPQQAQPPATPPDPAQASPQSPTQSLAPAPAATPSSASSADAPAPAQEPGADAASQPKPKTKEELAEQQLAQEKKQRVFGFLPSFNTSYIDSAVSLTVKQKFRLAFSQTTDPVQFGIAAFAAGIDEAEGGDRGYGGGPVGYLKRWGADYTDSFVGNMLGNAAFPAILHQDPRFFRRGYGSKTRRIFYAISTSFVCKHDVTGKWEPNYSNIAGNLAGGAISNFYVPKDERGIGNVFEGAALVTIEGGAGAILQEFWPDISRRFFHVDPTHGQDAINNKLQK
jgi:hypothetical protein